MAEKLSREHNEAVNRPRRIAVNFDVTFAINTLFESYPDVSSLVEHLFGFADAEGSQIDSIWWNWGEGNQAPYASDFLPLYEHALYRGWVEQGVDIVGLVLEATRRRGLEVFFTHRMNGSDNDLGPFARIAMKVEHPEWTFHTSWCTHRDNGYWNFSLAEVHEHVLQSLREVAERWAFDGMELDFGRSGAFFPAGQGWINRECMSDFVRQVRRMLLEIGRRRGRPFLLAARVPENLVGCHFDGLDVETWMREDLVDLLVLGVRSFDADLGAFRRIAGDKAIKLYPCIDDHHASDGYQNPGIEVLRGVAANWWRQGADGMYTFNFNHTEDAPYAGQDWQSHLLAYREIGELETLREKDKTFVVQRRGGGHGPTVIPNAEDWSTPRHMYSNSNMLGSLPAPLANGGGVDTLLQIYIADDLVSAAERLDSIALYVLLSDPAAEVLSEEQRLPPVLVATIGHARPGLMNVPAARGVEEQLRVRINNILLDRAVVEEGWLVFDVEPAALAVGENLVGISVEGCGLDGPEMSIEKVELRLQYRQYRQL